MSLAYWVLYQIAWYRCWWFCFAGIAYLSARYLGWPGVIGGAFVLFLFIVPIDVAWIFDEMRNHPENERDADMVFWFGVFVRTFLFNMVLIPVSIAGLKLRARSRRTPIEMKIA